MNDRSSYDLLWSKGIAPLVQDYRSKISGLVVCSDAKELIWENYVKFSQKCKNNYMIDPNGRLDRHKVCACYIYSIVKTHIIENTLFDEDDKKYLYINEKIAISVGLSLLRAFIIRNAKSNADMAQTKRNDILDRVADGIRIPECNHGNYIDNFASELYHTYLEGTYNILSLANTLFLLEIYTTDKEVLKNRKKKK